jgi:hypothetical protein
MQGFVNPYLMGICVRGWCKTQDDKTLRFTSKTLRSKTDYRSGLPCLFFGGGEELKIAPEIFSILHHAPFLEHLTNDMP